VSRLNPWQFLAGLARIVAARPRVPASLRDNQPLRTVLERRSVREFKPDPLPDDVWAAILEAGRVAPSTVNLQTWSFGVFTGDEWREFFAAPPPFGAVRLVVIMADTHRPRRVVEGFPRVPLCDLVVGVMNASLAAMNMTVAAEALGVASVMLSETGRTGFYDAAYLVEKLELPAGVLPVMTVAFGYPARGRPAMPPKLPLEAVSFTGAYREADREVLEDWYRQQQAGYQASNWGERFSGQIAYYNRRLAEADEDLARLVHREDRSGERGE
jgi:nitroreductase